MNELTRALCDPQHPGSFFIGGYFIKDGRGKIIKIVWGTEYEMSEPYDFHCECGHIIGFSGYRTKKKWRMECSNCGKRIDILIQNISKIERKRAA